MAKTEATVVVLKDNFAKVLGVVTGPMLVGAAMAGGHVIEAHAKINASRGRPGLEMETGALVNSIAVSLASSSATRAEVDTGPSVVYGRIHEVGGIIVPLHASRLAWFDKDTGEFHSALAVHIPARPYMRPAVDENKDSMLSAIATEVNRALGVATK